MLLAYASVRWWEIFTPNRCSGVNRFVALFAVPVLSFHFIADNDPYQMDLRFFLADSISKAAALLLLCLWAAFLGGTLDWSITLFSVATLPNTLVMGIPLLKAMYGDFTQTLMVQLVVLQCIIWYTLLLFLYEYRAAMAMIRSQFPGAAAASISRFQIDPDVLSLDGRDPLRTQSEIDGHGRIRVRIRRSTSSAPDAAPPSTAGFTPRASDLSNVEIISVDTFRHSVTEDPSGKGGWMGFPAASPPLSGYASSDLNTPRAPIGPEMLSAAAMGARSPVGLMD